MNEWMNEWMEERKIEWKKEKSNENECIEAWEVIGMKKDVRIGRFERFKRLRYQPTDQPTNRPTDMTCYRSAGTHLKKEQTEEV